MDEHERIFLEHKINELLGHPHFIIHTHEVENNKLIFTDLCKLEVVDLGEWRYHR